MTTSSPSPPASSNPDRACYRPLLWILLLGLVNFWTNSILMTTDMSLYCNAALNLVKGNGYVDMAFEPQLLRTPLWPIIIAGFFKVFGTSYQSAFIPVSLFCMLNPVLVYLIGRRWFDERAAFWAAILILTSYSLNANAYRHIDVVWPAFALGAILATDIGLKRESFWMICSAGVILGLGYLTKQSTMLLFPYPLALFLLFRPYRTRRNLKALACSGLITLAMLAPWFLWVHEISGDWMLALLSRTGKMAAGNSASQSTLPGYLAAFFAGLRDYYMGRYTSIAHNFTLAPLLLGGWLFAAWRAAKGERPYLKLLAVFLLLAPYMSYAGSKYLRLGQILLIIYLSYLLLSAMVHHAVARLCPGGLPRGSARVAFAVLCMALAAVQLLTRHRHDYSNLQYLRNSIIVQEAVGKTKEALGCKFPARLYFHQPVNGFFGRGGTLDTEKYLRARVAPGETIIADFMTPARGIFFALNGQNRVLVFPYIWNKRGFVFGDPPEDADELPMHVTPRGNPMNGPVHVLALYASQLFETIRANDVRYLVSSPYFPELKPYLDACPWLTKVSSHSTTVPMGGRFDIYTVDLTALPERGPGKTIWSKDFHDVAPLLKQLRPREYELYFDKFLIGMCGFDPADMPNFDLHLQEN